MRILLITSKWPTIDQEIDGGCMTGLNVLDTIVGYSRVDISQELTKLISTL